MLLLTWEIDFCRHSHKALASVVELMIISRRSMSLGLMVLSLVTREVRVKYNRNMTHFLRCKINRAVLLKNVIKLYVQVSHSRTVVHPLHLHTTYVQSHYSQTGFSYQYINSGDPSACQGRFLYHFNLYR